MITTITTSTVTVVTAIASMGLTAVISIAALISLIIFLTTKEVAGATHSTSQLRVARFINIGIIPLAMAFVVILLAQVLEVIG